MRLQNVLSIKFPDDFRDLYSIVDGFSDYEWRDNFFFIWSLKKIIEEFDVSDNGFIGFCDYSLHVFELGFHQNKPGIYRHYPSLPNVEDEYLINSFQKVIKLINLDSKLLY